MKHKIDPENCEFILDSENRIYGISFKLTERKSETYYMVQNNFFGSIRRLMLYKMQPFLYYNKEKFWQTYEIRLDYVLGICTKYYLDLSQWSIGTTQKPNEITLVSCNKPNFTMYVHP